MTKNRDLKERIRARMKKTNESYTAARRHVVAQRPKTWAEWVQTLDGLESAREQSGESLDSAVSREDLEGAMVALACDANPDLLAWQVGAALDHFVDEIRARVMATPSPGGRLESLLRVAYDEIGFAVPERYTDPELNHLDRILRTKRGTPAALAALLIVLGRRCDLDLRPVAFPGHFLVRAEVGDRTMLIDPATGMTVRSEGLVALAMDELSVSRARAEAHLEPTDVRSLVIRLLQNLATAYRARGKEDLGLLIANRLLTLSRSSSDHTTN